MIVTKFTIFLPDWAYFAKQLSSIGEDLLQMLLHCKFDLSYLKILVANLPASLNLDILISVQYSKMKQDTVYL